MGKFSSKFKEGTDGAKAVAAENATEQMHNAEVGNVHVGDGAKAEEIAAGDVSVGDAAVGVDTKAVKSIVPTKYAAKYKDPANDDPLRTFIKEQCGENGKINLPKFYQLLRANDIAEAEVAKFEALTENLGNDEKGNPIKPAGGVAGRAVMTLRNRLTPLARKGDGIKGLDGKTYDVKLPPAPKTGAVAAAAEKKAEAAAATTTDETKSKVEEVTEVGQNAV